MLKNWIADWSTARDFMVSKNDDDELCFLKYSGFRRQNRVLQHAVAAKMKKFAEQYFKDC